ncbi:helix-turn-helix domain-containing protein [Sediminitomix flava]|nr:helix-turn-helix domain-containing protein [Sediminitomix flava]
MAEMNMYTYIQSDEQYYSYCNKLERLVTIEAEGGEVDFIEIDFLTLLIQNYDERTSSIKPGNIHPVELIKYLMECHEMSIRILADKMNVHNSTVSKVLNHKLDISPKNAEKLSSIFALKPEVFIFFDKNKG